MILYNAAVEPPRSGRFRPPERSEGKNQLLDSFLILRNFPFSAICFALSKPLVIVILGSKWTGVIPLFSAMALVAISGPLGAVVSWLYQSQGRGKDQLRSHSAAGLATFAAYVAGLYWGPLGLILSLAVVSVTIRLPIVYYFAGRSGPVSTSDLWINFFAHLPAWGAAYLGAALTYMAVANRLPIVQLLICVPAGLLFGAVLLMPFRRARESAFNAYNAVKEVVIKQWSKA